MTSGTVTVNGISDKEVVMILELKERHPGKFNFGLQQLQPTNLPGNPPTSVYNNAVFTWSSHETFEIIMEILHRLSPQTKCHHHE